MSKWYYEKGEADKISSTRRALVKLNGVSLIAKARKRVADATTALTSAMSCMDKVQSLDQKIAQTMSGSEPNDDETETDSDANPTIQAAIKGLNDLEKECVERITLCEATVNGIAPFIKAFDNQWQEEVESCLVSDDQLAKKLGEADERTYTSTYTRALSFIYPDETGTHEGQIPTSSVRRGFIRATINGYIVLHALDNSRFTRITDRPSSLADIGQVSN